MFKMIFSGLSKNIDLRERLVRAGGIATFREIVFEMVERRKDVAVEDKLGWYLRYWKAKPARCYIKGITSPEAKLEVMQEEQKKEEEVVVEKEEEVVVDKEEEVGAEKKEESPRQEAKAE